MSLALRCISLLLIGAICLLGAVAFAGSPALAEASAPPLQLHADIVVLQNDGPAFPGEAAVIACGNRVPVPPAFSITGPRAATICVGLDPWAPPSRAMLAAGEGANRARLPAPQSHGVTPAPYCAAVVRDVDRPA